MSWVYKNKITDKQTTIIAIKIKSNKSNVVKFFCFWVGSNIEKYLLLANTLNELNLTSSYFVLKPFSFEGKTKIEEFENIVEKFKGQYLKWYYPITRW